MNMYTEMTLLDGIVMKRIKHRAKEMFSENGNRQQFEYWLTARKISIIHSLTEAIQIFYVKWLWKHKVWTCRSPENTQQERL